MYNSIEMSKRNMISQHDYTLGIECKLGLWLKYNRYDIKPMCCRHDMAYTNCHQIREHARKYFDQALELDLLSDKDASYRTRKAVAKGENIIFEAVAHTHFAYARANIIKNFGEFCDLIYIEGSTYVKSHYLNEISFQNYIFNKAGYKIRGCYLMTLNRGYIRKGDIDLQHLFRIEHINNDKLTHPMEVERQIYEMLDILSVNQKPKQRCRPPFRCEYRAHCWPELPRYSIFNVFNKRKSWDMYQIHGADIRNLPEQEWPKDKKAVDLECYIQKKEFTDVKKLKDFIGMLEYPLYFLDYEAFSSSIPLFDHTMPYHQIPFQFSLHIQNKYRGYLDHISFLYKNIGDPREALVDALITACGDQGSVIVYNKAFESMINRGLMHEFPELACLIGGITERMVDLLVPFKERYIYSHKQCGSASIKKALPAFTGISYDSMLVTNGRQASTWYLAYQQGKLSSSQQNDLFEGLLEYCKQDTLAMVKLLEAIRIRLE